MSLPAGFFDGAVRRILELQQPDGKIPWFDAGVFDPWNHVEAAMGLAVMGRIAEARRAYDAIAAIQEPDGSWWAQYGSAVHLETGRYEGSGNEPVKRDTNMAAYCAVGVWHLYRITGARSDLTRYWPMVKAATGFVLSLQSAHGEIRWAAPGPEAEPDDALLTGNCSIYKSLACAVLIAATLGHDTREWHTARTQLGEAIRARPERFDRTWEKKDYFSMDWYYPVRAGVLTGDAARARLAARWDAFVIPGKGCRCVLGQPWVTIAEGCELALALAASGDRERAREMFHWQDQWRGEDRSYWMGFQVEMGVPWPIERPAWTAGAAILAADALYRLSPAWDLFLVPSGGEPHQEPQGLHGL
jgi:GH15 family glucan-1,4-alpha-glucosidase